MHLRNGNIVMDATKTVDGVDLSVDAILRNGSVAFTAVIEGVTPTADAHLATKGYVDGLIAGTDDHNELNNIQGGTTDEYYHLTATQHTDLTDAGDSALHYHSTDRNRSNHSGTQTASTISDFVAEAKAAAGAMVTGNTETGIAVTYQSGDNTLDFAVEYGTEPGAVSSSTSGSAGSADSASRSDHSHDLGTHTHADAATGGTIDHGALTGRGDDDHTIYILADGSRAFSGTVVGVTPTLGTHLVTKDYVDGLLQGVSDWQTSVLDRTNEAGATETTGFRYISTETSGTWTINNIYQYNGSGWDETTVSEGMATWVEDEDVMYVFNGSAWVKFGTTTTHNNLSGLQGGTTDEYYHLTSAQQSGLTGSGETALHTHDHGALNGTGDDDHTQYILAAGTRAFSGNQSLGGNDLTSVGNIALSTINGLPFVAASNADVDTGTEVVDSFADTLGRSAFWNYVASDGTNFRAGQVIACWNATADTVSFYDVSTDDIGDTSGVSFTVAINTNNVELSATVGTDNWDVAVSRMVIV